GAKYRLDQFIPRAQTKSPPLRHDVAQERSAPVFTPYDFGGLSAARAIQIFANTAQFVDHCRRTGSFYELNTAPFGSDDPIKIRRQPEIRIKAANPIIGSSVGKHRLMAEIHTLPQIPRCNDQERAVDFGIELYEVREAKHRLLRIAGHSRVDE